MVTLTLTPRTPADLVTTTVGTATPRLPLLFTQVGSPTTLSLLLPRTPGSLTLTPNT